MLRRALLLSTSLLLCACSSEEKAPPPPPPRPTTRAADPAPAAAAPAAQKKAPETIVLSVKQADLATMVLPEFERQVGVKILWLGDPRPVTLRLTQPMHWHEALKLVCQFTKTHLTTDYQGRKVLKDGWGGELGDGDIDSLQRSGRGTISSSTSGRSSGSGGGGGGATQPAWNGGGASGGGGGGGSAIPQPTGAYSGGAEANAILKGVGMNSSNGGNAPR
jgi:hypothetical protein